MKTPIILFAVLVALTPALADIGMSGIMTSGPTYTADPTAGLLPTDRGAYANWHNAGLQSVGGIPTNRTQCGSTLTPSGGDDTTAIQNAVNACTTGHFVKLSAGTFTIAEGEQVFINISGITVRGSGPCAGTGIGAIPYGGTQTYCTLIQRTGGTVLYSQGGSSSSSHFVMGAGDQYGNSLFGTTTNLAADGAQGATTIQVASTTGFTVGQAILLDEPSPNMGWRASWIYPTETQWSSADYRMNWLAQNPTCDNADKFCQGGSTNPGIPCYFSWTGNTDCNAWVNEIKQIASIGAGPCPGTSCTITFDDPLMISYRGAEGAHVAVLYGGTSGTNQANTYVGLESMTLQNADEPSVWLNLCNYCWLKNVEIDVMASNISAGAVAIESGFRDQLEGVYIHDGGHPYPGGAGYNLSLDLGSTEILVEDSISMTNDKLMVARMGGSGSVIAYNYFDEAILGGNTVGQTEDGANSSHWLGPHHLLFEGNWTFQASNDPVWGPTIFDTWFRNDVTGYRTKFYDGADGFTIDDANNLPGLPSACGGSNGHNCADGVNMAVFDYWQSFIGNVIGTSGKMSGWSYYSNTAGTSNLIWAMGQISNTSLNAIDNEVWTQQSGAAACTTTSGDQCPVIRSLNYDYVTNSINDPSVGVGLPNSFVFASAPAYFSAGYTWPWATPTASTQIQSGPTTSACTANVGGPCSGLPAKARMDNGTPFTQP